MELYAGAILSIWKSRFWNFIFHVVLSYGPVVFWRIFLSIRSVFCIIVFKIPSTHYYQNFLLIVRETAYAELKIADWILIVSNFFFFLSPNSIKVNYPMHVCVTKTQHSFLIKMCWRHFKYNHSTDTLKEYKTSVIEHQEIHSWVPDEQSNLEYCFVNIENSWLWYYF